MAQPTLEGLTLNAGSGGSDLAGDTVSSKIWQAILVGYSTGDGTANVVMADTGLPVVPATAATWDCTQSGTWNITNVSGTISLPTGAATSALQTTGNGLLTTIDADTGAIKTAVELLDNAISGAGFNVTQFAGAAVPIGAGLEATALRVTLATDLTGVVSVDDNGGALTVDGTVAATQSGTWNVGTVTTVTTVAAVTAISNALPAGSNAIGKLAANSGVDIGDVDVTSIAAGTNTIGGVIGQISSSTLYDGVTACTIKRVSGVAASGTTAMVSAVAGKKFRILAIALFATSATVTNVYVATTTDTDVLGNSGNPIPLATDADGDNVAGFVLPYNQGGWAETSTANEDLNLILSAAQDVIYALTYIEVA